MSLFPKRKKEKKKERKKSGVVTVRICCAEQMFSSLHSKKCWVVLTQLWVKYGLTQPLG